METQRPTADSRKEQPRTSLPSYYSFIIGQIKRRCALVQATRRVAARERAQQEEIQ